ncbi:MAG: hypothetical protein HGA80_08615 [Candidatus Omnitrophica bacterium]|nr:hypothetical protein [Candidatus Omnitrophota bacterium]
MNSNISSEEKLLGLLRKKQPVRVAQSKAAGKAADGLDWKSAASIFWQWGTVIFIAGSTGLLTILFIKYQSGLRAENPASEASSVPDHSLDKPASSEEIVQPNVANYQEIIRARDIFSLPVEQKKETVTSIQAPQSPVAERYKVVGIMLDSNPTAILEDIKSHETVIVTKGQNLEDATVEEIKADRVILKTADQPVELMR